MIALDTCVLIRFLVQDDPAQSRIATRFFDTLTVETPGYLCTITLVEAVWVLTRSYKYSRAEIGKAISMLLSTRELVVEEKAAATLALGIYLVSTADFPDALIAQRARLAGCSETVTFDKSAVAQAGMRLLK